MDFIEDSSLGINLEGQRWWVAVKDVTISDEDFEWLGDNFEKDCKVVRGNAGSAEDRLLSL